MGFTEAAKIKISKRLGSSAKSAFFQISDSSSLWGPLNDFGQKDVQRMTPIKIWFLRGSLLYLECLTLKLKNLFGVGYFFPESDQFFFWFKKLKFCRDKTLENKFIFFKKILFVKIGQKLWTKDDWALESTLVFYP